jgi:DNA helicase MCM8
MNISELTMIHKLAERRDLFPLLVKSICPSIFGNEIVKCGLLLCLFGGTDYRLKSKGNEFNEILLNAGAEGKDISGMCNLFGNEEDLDDVGGTMPPIRPDIHCLMMGDPGLGKS